MIGFTVCQGLTRPIFSRITTYSNPLCVHKRFRARKFKRSFEAKKVIFEQIPTYSFASEGKLQVHDRIYIWGFASTGALGFPNLLDPEIGKQRSEWPIPRKLGFFHYFNVKDIACGYGFTVILAKKSDVKHTLFGMGVNSDRQIGLQLAKNTDVPLEVITAPSPICLPHILESTIFDQVAAGRCHTVVLSKNKVAFSFGNNAFGQCGRPVVDDEIFPHLPQINKVEGIEEPISKVICGQDHTLFLTEKGEVYACGLGADGQTGLGHYENVGIPQKVKGDIEGERIVEISSAVDGTLACNDKGDLFGWGNSEYSQFKIVTPECQLNIPRRLPISLGKVVKVAAGGTFCGVVNDKGQVYVWGFGILGQGPRVDHLAEPSLLPEPLFGTDEVNPDVKVTHLFAGISRWAAINSKGDLFCWGKNRHGCLGFNDKRDRFFPFRVNLPLHVKKVSLGPDHTAIIGRTLI